MSSSADAPTPPVPQASLLLDAAALSRILRRMAHEIVEAHPDLSKVALVGIPSRGTVVAQRLGQYLQEISGTEVEQGVVDISMHRDDLHTRAGWGPMEPTHLPVDLAQKIIILTDDVLYSGRTCRAALDAISYFGRPRRIEYAVLIDRGHRELPIRADYVGKNVPTAYHQRVFVRFQAVDGTTEDAVWVEKAS